VVTIGGFSLLHNGDAALDVAEEYCRFDLTSLGLDVAFLGGLLWPPVQPRLETVRRCLDPGHIVVMHLDSEGKSTIADRIEALDADLPPIVVPGERMTEVALP